jgi:hypothetical protein
MVGVPFIHPLVGDVQYCGAEIEIAFAYFIIAPASSSVLLFYYNFFFHLVCVIGLQN